MMIPEAWENADRMDRARRDFYAFHSTLMEPWDGPACVTFTDGTVIGAVLDRNGLRPGRWWRTSRRPGDPGQRGRRDRHRPGHRDRQGPAAAGPDVPGRHRGRRDPRRRRDQVRAGRRTPLRRLAARRPAAPGHACPTASTSCTPTSRWPGASSCSATPRRSCGSSSTPMATTGGEPLGSMGTDTPLAVLSKRPRLLFDYFAELFAQVTNPPLDAIREELVTSLAGTIGPEQNLLAPVAGVLPADRAAQAGDRQRRPGQDLARQRRRRPARLPVRADRRPVPGARRRPGADRGAAAGAGRVLGARSRPAPGS